MKATCGGEVFKREMKLGAAQSWEALVKLEKPRL